MEKGNRGEDPKKSSGPKNKSYSDSRKPRSDDRSDNRRDRSDNREDRTERKPRSNSRGDRSDNRGGSDRPHQRKERTVRKDNSDKWNGPGKKKIGARPRIMVANSWAAKGEAIIPDDKRTLVWAGIPNEKAIVQITHRGQHQNYGHFVSTHEPSEFRREAPCRRYDRCGGCPLMHLTPEGQVIAKLEMFRQEVNKKDIEIEIPTELIQVGGDERYRFVSKLVTGRANHGTIRLGARNRDGSIIPIPDCLVHDQALNKLGKKIAHWIQELEIYPYTKTKPKGLRYVVIRKARETEKILVTLISTGRSELLEQLAELIALSSRNVHGVVLHFNSQVGNSIFERDEDGRVRYQQIEGQGKIIETISGLQYEMGPGDFFQINLSIAERLQQDVIEASRQFTGYPMIDLYCGVGFFTLALSREHGWALGIEGAGSAIERAKRNAELNSMKVDFRAGDVCEELDGVAKVLGKASPCIVVDPARRGLEEGVIEQLIDLNPAGIIYISCHPTTLLRDCKIFQDAGWTVQKPKLYDMFPQTVHVEAMVVLTPPKTAILHKKSNPRRVVISNY